MKTRLTVRSVVVAGAALFAVCAADTAHALPKGPVDPPDPTIKQPPTKPPPLVCATPTLTDCNDPTYLDSACGQKSQNQTTCGNLVLPSYQAAVRSVTDTTTVLRDDTTARLEVGKKLTPIAMPAVKDTFGTFSFATTKQRGRTLLPSAATATTTPQHPDYEANGNAVASCQEYAYESQYDDMRFTEAAETCGTNAECVYQLSLLTATPGLKVTMLKKNATAAAWQPVRTGAFTQNKNVFFAKGDAALTVGASYLTHHPDYATDAAFKAKADQIIAWVNAQPKTTAVNELAWHRQMHDAFAAQPVTSVELSSIQQREGVYGTALTDGAVANLAVALLSAVIPGQSGQTRADSEALLAQYQAQNTRALAAMSSGLFAEWDRVDPATGVVDHGCLDKANVKCDWSPTQFVSRFAHPNTSINEQLFDDCITASKGNFANVPAAYRTDTDQLASWIAAQGLPKTSVAAVGQHMSDGDEWGDRNWFAAGYSYDAGWQLAADRQPGTGRICKLKGDAYAQGSANAYAFNQTIPVLDTRHKVTARETGDTVTAHSHLRALGYDLYTPIDVSGTLPTEGVTKSANTTLAEKTYTTWISIAAVQVKLQAKMEIKAGVDFTAKAVAGHGCDPENLAYDASVSANPWITVHTVPEVSVGIAIIQGGVRGDIDLIKVSAPVSAGVKTVGTANNPVLQFRANANVDLSLLKGNIDIFLESCIPWVGCTDLASKQIYSFDGYAWNIPLLAYSKDVTLPIFDTATKSGTIIVGPMPPPVLLSATSMESL